MAKYNVTYSCGHTGEVQLFGPGKDRDRKLAWYRTQADCPACFKARQQTERAAAATADTQAIGDVFGDLPAIDAGSEKQIDWAGRVRAEKLAAVRSFVATLRVNAAGDPVRLAQIAEGDVKITAALAGLVAAHKDATWWIDRRDLSSEDIVGLAMREAAK